jgi:diadenosine tetraphosphate (Ap4A) HIT family hydrolase
MCAEGRPDETRDGVRIFAGATADGYLTRAAIQRGYAVVVWRGRHVAEPTELAPDEARDYWTEVLEVARAIEVHLHPVKVNYNVLGNSVPHLHTHIVPRYADDPRPGWPFPFPETDPPPFEQRMFTADVEALRRLIDQTNSGSA